MTEKRNILFVCARNRWRSPTAVQIYRNDQRMNLRSAGLSPKSKRAIGRADIEWADLILVMESAHKNRITDDFRDMEVPRIECLDIPDD